MIILESQHWRLKCEGGSRMAGRTSGEKNSLAKLETSCSPTQLSRTSDSRRPPFLAESTITLEIAIYSETPNPCSPAVKFS